MSLTLTGEISFFNTDMGLVGHDLHDQNEPEGDDFATRCENKNNALRYGHAWFDVQNGYCTSDDLFVAAKELRGTYARFCDMTGAEQTKFVYEVTMHICALVGVSVCDWEPSDEFVLDAIQDELSDEDLKKAALEIYVPPVTHVKREPSSVGGEFDVATDPELIGISQQSTRFKKHLTRDEEDEKDKKRHRRGLSTNGRNRACFYSGRRALSIRRDSEHCFGFAGKGNGFEEYVDRLIENGWEAMFEEVDVDGEGVDTEYPDVFDFPYAKYAEMRSVGYEEYTQENVREKRATRVRLVRCDPWDLGESVYDFDAAFNDCDYQCHCPQCMGDDWFDMSDIIDEDDDADLRSLFVRFGDRYDGNSFADYGPSDREIDLIQFGHSSRLQLTGRYRKMVALL